MTPESLIAFNLVLAAAIASPGAAFLMALKTALSSGRAAGIATGAGLATMAATWTLAALLGLETVFALFPWAYSALKVMGAAYLLWLAIETWRHARAPLPQVSAPRSRAYLAGLVVNLGNPKSVLFAAAVIVVVFPQGLAPAEIALIVGNHFLLEVLFYTTFAVALTTTRARTAYLALKPVLDRIAATLLGALGLRLLLEK
jgi:threonine/homoserine/homoserine lactone efflux protein